MRLADFDFDLPKSQIALRPASPRDAARLLVVDRQQDLVERRVCDLPGLLRPGDALVFNDTRVIAARLTGRRLRQNSTVAVEATLHQRLGPALWSAFMRPGKRLAVGDRVQFGLELDRACQASSLGATLIEKRDGGEVVLAFDLAGPDLDLAIDVHGVMPLPPYIASQRPQDDQDRTDYQTIYARHSGSVAAPTAGLHFTTELLQRLRSMGVTTHFVTLQVGAGTFLPVKTDALSDHKMHAESGEVSDDTARSLNAAKAAGNRVICVGTTSLRLLESATGDDGQLKAFSGETAIFITPGYKFRFVDGLLTNFHLPKSTLFVLVSAFCGVQTMRDAYAWAIAKGFAFYSYGDASLLWREA